MLHRFMHNHFCLFTYRIIYLRQNYLFLHPLHSCIVHSIIILRSHWVAGGDGVPPFAPDITLIYYFSVAASSQGGAPRVTPTRTPTGVCPTVWYPPEYVIL